MTSEAQSSARLEMKPEVLTCMTSFVLQVLGGAAESGNRIYEDRNVDEFSLPFTQVKSALR